MDDAEYDTEYTQNTKEYEGGENRDNDDAMYFSDDDLALSAENAQDSRRIAAQETNGIADAADELIDDEFEPSHQTHGVASDMGGDDRDGSAECESDSFQQHEKLSESWSDEAKFQDQLSALASKMKMGTDAPPDEDTQLDDAVFTDSLKHLANRRAAMESMKSLVLSHLQKSSEQLFDALQANFRKVEQKLNSLVSATTSQVDESVAAVERARASFNRNQQFTQQCCESFGFPQLHS